jgi:hypothetical protein
MAKFVFTYRGGGDMPQTQTERDAVMAAWMGWFETAGSAVKDPGNPFGASASVKAGGVSDGTASGVTGYSIVEAADLSAATAIAAGCPLLEAPDGVVEVHEALAM